MKTIEDVVIAMSTFGFYGLCRLNRFETTIIDSIASQLIQGSGFTVKQAAVVLRIISKYSNDISDSVSNISQLIANPVYRLPLRQLQTEKLLSIEHDASGKKVIVVAFPYDQSKVDRIKKSRNDVVNPIWDSERRVWVFTLCEAAIVFLKDLITDDGFSVDEEFAAYIEQANHIINNIDQHVPMVDYVDGVVQYKNVSQYVPALNQEPFIDCLFSAIKSGITVWSDSVNAALTDSQYNPLTRDFLLTAENRIFDIDSEKYSLELLGDVIKHMSPGIFVLPGGSELSYLKRVHQLLTSLGFSNNQITVMFRLPTKTDRDFNEYIKEHGLNSNLTNNTQFVIISAKVPKPVLQSDIHFNSVISFGKFSAHYTVRELMNSCQRLIYYCEKRKELDFGHM